MTPRHSKILLIEDDPDIRDLISLHLYRSGFSVAEAATVREAEDRMRGAELSLAIVDWMLPGESGVQFVERLKQEPERHPFPVLMVTAKSEPQDIVRGLESGADDYVVKPFEASVLMARVKALIRRSGARSERAADSRGAAVPRTLRFGDLTVSPEAFEARVRGQTISLTPSEFKLLLALAENRGKVLTRDRLIELVQGEGISVIDRAVDTHVFGLRKKLGAAAEWVETVRGVGYRLRWEDDPA